VHPTPPPHFFKYCQWVESGSDQELSYPLTIMAHVLWLSFWRSIRRKNERTVCMFLSKCGCFVLCACVYTCWSCICVCHTGPFCTLIFGAINTQCFLGVSLCPLPFCSLPSFIPISHGVSQSNNATSLKTNRANRWP